jgi:2-keto-3-deoxy-galactonokinase
LPTGAHLLCLPGTHTKWVMLNNGVLEHFLTGVTGELFDVLLRHSVLVRAPGSARRRADRRSSMRSEQTKASSGRRIDSSAVRRAQPPIHG